MSTANLNVWITRLGDPCHIDDQHKWYVHITDCAGHPLALEFRPSAISSPTSRW